MSDQGDLFDWNGTVHPAADIFPLLDEEGAASLAGSIRGHGLLHALTLDPAGTLLDGRNRLKACGAAEVEPRFAVHEGDAVAFIIASNLERRHLGTSQRSMVAEKLANLELGVKKADRQNCLSQDEAASLLNVSPRSVRSAAEVKKKAPELAEKVVAGDLTLGAAVSQIHAKEREAAKAAQIAASPRRPIIALADYRDWLVKQPPCDLLLTDPPYSTDVAGDFMEFVNAWLPKALAKVSPTGRAYVCVGAYPHELNAYLTVASQVGSIYLAQVLVWTYRNTLGPKPTHTYKQNWQAVLYFVGPEAMPLDCPEMLEQFSVQEINAPDGRQGDRYDAWQKPDELAERFIRHATKPGDLVYDCFAGTGTHLLAAARLGRVGIGCDSDPEMVDLAESRGCLHAR